MIIGRLEIITVFVLFQSRTGGIAGDFMIRIVLTFSRFSGVLH